MPEKTPDGRIRVVAERWLDCRMAWQLTPHFTLEEFCLSQEAVRAGIDNTPPPVAVANLVRMAKLLEKVRELLKKPMLITSGYRSPELNRRIGGSPKSAHVDGRAADFICPAFGTPYAVAKRIATARLGFDQMIHEYGRWVHIAVPRAREPAQRELLSIFEAGRYLPGLTELDEGRA
jgi:zinc D-Ala-D-Ala carboxypeptidase